MNIRQHVRHIGSVMCGMILTIGTLGVTVTDATTYYTAPTGNDANPGTQASPFRTINRGVKALKPGDTLRVKGGTYPETLQNPLPSGLSASQPTTIEGDPAPNRPIIKPSGGSANIVLLSQDRSHIKFKYLVIDGSAHSGSGVVPFNIDNSRKISGLVIEDSEFIGHAKGGVVLKIGAGTVATVRRSTFKRPINCMGGNPSCSGKVGVYWQGSNGLFEHNEIFWMGHYGVQIYSTKGGTNSNIVRHNYIHHNQGALYIGTGSNNEAYRNVVVNNGGGLGVVGSSTKIYNNTIYNNNGAGGARGGIRLIGGSNHYIRNNITYQHSGGNIVRINGSGTLSHNLCTGHSSCAVTSDPQFVDAAGGNFTLRATSPAINAGTSSVAPGITVTGNGSPDIGAYEYGATGVAVSAPKSIRIIPAD